MDREAKEWAEYIGRNPTKAIREAYIKKTILGLINDKWGEE